MLGSWWPNWKGSKRKRSWHILSDHVFFKNWGRQQYPSQKTPELYSTISKRIFARDGNGISILLSWSRLRSSVTEHRIWVGYEPLAIERGRLAVNSVELYSGVARRKSWLAEEFRGFPQFLQDKCRDNISVRLHNNFHSNPFLFTVHLWSYDFGML
jgi:hypothetical protein